MHNPVQGGVLVTGASSGIGAAVARELAFRGFTVGCASRRGCVPRTGHEASGKLIGFVCDVSDQQAVEQTVRTFAEQARGIGGLVNAAGGVSATRSAELELDELRRTMELNFISTFGVCRQVYPYLRERGGLIVNLGSFYDQKGVPSHLAYSASKAAIASMGRTLAVEWARDGISVLTVAPGYILTGLNAEYLSNPERRQAVERRIPVRRVGQPEEVGRVIGALFEAQVPFLTGATIYLDGAQHVSL